jgi:hypothetical protein
MPTRQPINSIEFGPRDADYFRFKHAEFEEIIANLGPGVKSREIGLNARKVSQHIVHTATGVLRWPVSYEHGKEAQKEQTQKKKKKASEN